MPIGSSTPPPRQTEPFPPVTHEDKLAVIALAAQWYHYSGAREQDIRKRYGVSATRFYQVLNVLIDEPEIVKDCPAECRRFREQRDTRALVRTAVRRKLGRRWGIARLP